MLLNIRTKWKIGITTALIFLSFQCWAATYEELNKTWDFADGPAPFIESCDGGDPDSCNWIAVQYLSGGKVVKKDRKKANHYFLAAAKLYEKQCINKSAPSCQSLGLYYLNGYGLETSIEKGIAELVKACDLNQYYSCEVVGDIFHSGSYFNLRRKEDLPRALFYFDKVCATRSESGKLDEGVKRSCIKLGKMYLYGQGTTIDKEKGTLFVKTAYRQNELGCSKGQVNDCEEMAYMHGTILSNKAEGMKYEIRNCELGVASSCSIVAFSYKYGEDVPEDKEKAKHFSRLFCEAEKKQNKHSDDCQK